MHLIVGRLLRSRRRGSAVGSRCAASAGEVEEDEAADWCRARRNGRPTDATRSGVEPKKMPAAMSRALGDQIRRPPWRTRSRHGAGAARQCEPPPTCTTSVSPRMNVHALDWNMQQIGNHLRKARLVALTAWLRTDDRIDAPLRSHADARLLMGSADRGIPRSWLARWPSSLPRSAAARRRAANEFPVGDHHRPIHVLRV